MRVPGLIMLKFVLLEIFSDHMHTYLGLSNWSRGENVAAVSKSFQVHTHFGLQILFIYSPSYLRHRWLQRVLNLFNPFVPNAPFFYPLKTSENLTIFWCFQGIEKWCIGNTLVNLARKSHLEKSWKISNYCQWRGSFAVHLWS